MTEPKSPFNKDILKRLSYSDRHQYVKHDIVPMRSSDQKHFSVVSPSHWLFIKYLTIDSNHYQIRIYPCNEEGLSCWNKPYWIMPSVGNTYQTMKYDAIFKGIA